MRVNKVDMEVNYSIQLMLLLFNVENGTTKTSASTEKCDGGMAIKKA